jgi:Tfp pilus assembly protein PilN
VKRFNYLGGAREPFAAKLNTIAIDNRIRGPLAALLATIVLTATLSVVELARLRAAQDAYATVSQGLAADQHAVDEVNVLRANVLAKLHLSDRVAAIRRSSLAHANELTWIGNHLPAKMWLHVLRYENSGYSLEGTSERATAVAAALLALHDEAHGLVPQLMSLEDDANASTIRVRYRLHIEAQP